MQSWEQAKARELAVLKSTREIMQGTQICMELLIWISDKQSLEDMVQWQEEVWLWKTNIIRSIATKTSAQSNKWCIELNQSEATLL